MGTVGPWTRPVLHVGSAAAREDGERVLRQVRAEIAGGSAESHGEGDAKSGSKSGHCWARVKVGLWFTGPWDEQGLRRQELGGEGLG